MKTVLFFLTSEFPFGQGETFIENEISLLADAFDSVVIVPLRQTSTEHRFIPNNVCIQPVHNYKTSWLEVLITITRNEEVTKELLQNTLSNPLKNKVLLNSLRNASSIKKHLMNLRKTHDPEHRGLFYSYWLDDGAVAIALLNCEQLKVSRAHGWDIYFERHAYGYLPLRKFLADRLDKIFTVSENGRAYIAQKTARPEKIAVARLGTFNDTPFESNTDASSLTVITLSSAIPLKRIHLVGQAVQLIHNSQVRWNHFGDGPLLDQMKQEFPSATFHGHVNNAEVKAFLKHLSPSSILVNTSTNEGIPVSMMEAMSFGIPCLGTNVGGVSEIIEDGVNGFLMPENPTSDIVAQYIEKYLNLPTEAKKQLRLNAFKSWEEKFNARRNYSNFINDIKTP